MSNLALAVADTTALAPLLSRARAALDEVESVEDALQVADFAESVRYAMKQAKVGLQASNEAAEVRLRAERRAGELLAATIQQGGNPKSHDVTLDSVGVSRMQSSRYQQVAEIPGETFEAYISDKKSRAEEITTSRLLRLGREAKAAERNHQAAKDIDLSADGSTTIHHGDFWTIPFELATADLIFTDPPYPAEFLPEWEKLAAFASQILKPGRLLVSYTGQYHLPEVMHALSCELEYVWSGALVTPGAHNQVQRRHVRSACKPLLFYSAGEYEPDGWFDDAYVSEQRSKDHHAWEQSLGAAVYFIERLTQPGDLVIDPFLGSGTTAVACKQIGRRFIGYDVDENAINAAKVRLAA